MGHLHCPDLRFSSLCHGEVKEIEGNEELRGMSLSYLRWSTIDKFPLQFTSSSTRYCPECKIDVGLSFAGEINWKAHITSSAHIENVKKAAAIPSKTLLSYFNKKATSSPLEAPRSSSTLGPFRLSSSLMPGVPSSLPIAQHLHESVAH